MAGHVGWPLEKDGSQVKVAQATVDLLPGKKAKKNGDSQTADMLLRVLRNAAATQPVRGTRTGVAKAAKKSSTKLS